MPILRDILILGRDLLTDYKVEVRDLFRWVMTGQLQPFTTEDYPKQAYMDTACPPSYRRVFPPRSIYGDNIYEFLQYEHIKLLQKVANGLPEPEFIKLQWQLKQLQAEMSRAWQMVDGDNYTFFEIIELLKDSYFKLYDIERLLSLDKNGSTENDDNGLSPTTPISEAQDQEHACSENALQPSPFAKDAIERAKVLHPIVAMLYKTTMKNHRRLAVHPPEVCLKTALDILDENPNVYSPISKADITTDLFSENPQSARRDFVGKLLQRLLKKEEIEISNYQTLYGTIRNN